MKTEKQLLDQLRALRELANTLPHPTSIDSKSIRTNPRIKVMALIEKTLVELKTYYKYEEPEPDHPVKWVNDLLKGMGIQHLSGTRSVTIRSQVLDNGQYVDVQYVQIGDKVYYEDGRVVDIESLRPRNDPAA